MKYIFVLIAILLMVGTASAANLLSAPESIDDAAWTKYLVTVSTNNATDPRGGSGAELVNVAAGVDEHRFNQATTITTNLNYTVSGYFKKSGTNDFVQLSLSEPRFGTGIYGTFNLSDGTISASGTNSTTAIADSGGGWHRCSLTVKSLSGGSGSAVVAFTGGLSGRVPTFSGEANTTMAFYAWGVILEQSDIASEYMFASTSLNNSLTSPLSGTYRFYPDDAIWNARTDDLPIHADSDRWMNNISSQNTEANRHLWYNYLNAGTYFVVNDSFYKENFTSGATYYSDNISYPFPSDLWWMPCGTDHPATLIDTENEIMYELLALSGNTTAGFSGKGFVWNYSGYGYRFSPNTYLGETYYLGTTGALRTNTTPYWGTDAVGLPTTPGTLRYEEVATGYINHSLRLVVGKMDTEYLWPAPGSAGFWTGEGVPGGAWIRLNASYDTSSLGTQAKVVATALKEYGGYVADNGGLGITLYGFNNTGFNAVDMTTLKTIPLTAFEGVDVSSLMIEQYSMQAAGYPVATEESIILLIIYYFRMFFYMVGVNLI